jgi:hypothetical protein
MTTIHMPAITIQQRDYLSLIFKYRFTTPILISLSRQTTTDTTRKTLSILERKKLIGKRYDSSYKLLGKSARYYLLPASFPLLRQTLGRKETLLHKRYKDAKATNEYVDHCVAIFTLCIDIASRYSQLKVSLRDEMRQDESYPRPLPDVYIKDPTKYKRRSEYFIDIFDNVPLFVIRQRIKKYIQLIEDQLWERKKYPIVVLIIQQQTLRTRAKKYLAQVIEDWELDPDETTIRIESEFTLSI